MDRLKTGLRVTYVDCESVMLGLGLGLKALALEV